MMSHESCIRFVTEISTAPKLGLSMELTFTFLSGGKMRQKEEEKIEEEEEEEEKKKEEECSQFILNQNC